MSRRTFQRVCEPLTEDVDTSTSRTGTTDVSSSPHMMTSQIKQDIKTYTEEQVLEKLTAHLHIHAEGLLQTEGCEGSKNPYDSLLKQGKPGRGKGNSTHYRNDAHKAPSKLPVAAAHHKKRSTTTRCKGGRTLSGLQQVSINKYRPDYTWNRGGRVKELRIRNIGRKYLYIWIRKVYGRLNPNVARVHYSKKLVRQVFTTWYEVWWTNVREWRLTVRAECQYRYTVWRHVFQEWRGYVRQRKDKKSRLAAADHHANRRLLDQSLSAWRAHHLTRREHHRLRVYAEETYLNNLQRRTWQRWIQQYEIQQQRRQMETVSLQFWSYRIQIQHWLLWCQVYQDRLTEKERLRRAARIYENGLLVKCFHSLLTYSQIRKFKQSRKEFAQKVYQSNLVNMCLSQWYERFRMRWSLAEHEHRLKFLARRITLRRTLTQWKLYICLKHDQREKIEQADLHYLRHLLVLSLNGLRLACVRRRMKITRQQIAADFYNRQLIRQTWARWLYRCEEKENLHMLPQTQLARNHYRLCTLRKCWHTLVQYKLYKQHKQSLEIKAEAYFYWANLPKYFFRMKVFVHIMKNKQYNSQKAEQFRRENLQARFFYQWFVESEKSQNDRMAERMAIVQYDGNLGRRFLRMWRQKTQEVLEEQEKMALAAEHDSRAVCRNALNIWRQYVDELRRSQKNDVKAAKHLYLQRIKRSLIAWKMYQEKKKKKTSRQQKAVSHYHHKQCRLVLQRWCVYLTQRRQQKAAAEEKYQAKCDLLRRWVIQTWGRRIHENIQEREANKRAETHHNRRILVKVLKTWHRFAAIHAYKKSETAQLVMQGQEELHTGILRRSFLHWRLARDEALILTLKHEQAVQHHQNCVGLRTLQAWKHFCQLSYRKKLLARQALWFRQTVAQTRYFACWKQEHEQAQEKQAKTNLALWHWCLSLQRRVLILWWSYTENRRRKKVRHTEALDRRQLRLLREGATQWLRVAHELTQFRAKFAAQQHSKSAYDTYQLVQKFALRWKLTVARRKTSQQMSSQIPRESHDPPRSRIIPTAPVLSLSPVIGQRFKAIPEGSVQAESESSHALTLRLMRPRPRQPDFLIDSLKREGLLTTSSGHKGFRSKPDDSGSDKQIGILQPEIKAVACDRPTVISSEENRVQQPYQLPCHRPRVILPEENSVSQLPCHLSTVISPDPKPGGNAEEVLPPDQVTKGSQEPVLSRLGVRLASKPHHHVPHVHTQAGSGITPFPQDTGITLLTPAAFLTKKDGTLIPEVKPLHHSGDNQTSKSRLTCTVLPGDTVATWTSHSEQIHKEREVVQIRDTLKQFEEKKKKLKVLKSQWKQLSSLIKDQRMTDDSVEDEDTRNIRDELVQITEEISILKKEISKDKPQCELLVRRVQELMKLQQPG
ncbi:protein SFI1 homolog isoform X2 [Liolophura sinensis]|uniref:protein SFI1 homolog isoform X2 n=1 Tax=Liolophura sinensis TaxID=3198878 RepID=UPI0031584C6F